jgi:hypothetical protein
LLINPKVKKLVIFNGGGGIVERKIKISLNRGLNKFEIQDVPASFDPNSANIELNYLQPEDIDFISLQQTIVSLPDKTNAQRIIDREKSAANNIISHAIDFTREMREKISNICEASSYRTYSDMKGVFNFIINSKKKGEVIADIKYFIADLRIKWETTLQVNMNDDGKSGSLEAYIVVDNQTGFSYEDVELGFAIFELPKSSSDKPMPQPMTSNIAMEQQAFSKLPTQKRTQRMKNLML